MCLKVLFGWWENVGKCYGGDGDGDFLTAACEA